MASLGSEGQVHWFTLSGRRTCPCDSVILKICLNEFLYQGREVSSCRFPESKQEASRIQCDTPIFLHVCRKVYEVGIWGAARLDILILYFIFPVAQTGRQHFLPHILYLP